MLGDRRCHGWCTRVEPETLQNFPGSVWRTNRCQNSLAPQAAWALQMGRGSRCARLRQKTGTVLGEVKISGIVGSMPMTYMVNGKQYIAFTVGTATEPAEVVALALEK